MERRLATNPVRAHADIEHPQPPLGAYLRNIAANGDLRAVGAYMLVERERDSFERAALDRARALMTAIDAELRASINPLEMLARSPALDADDLGAFRVEAQRALEGRRGDWSNIVVSHPDTAQMVLNLLVPAGVDWVLD